MVTLLPIVGCAQVLSVDEYRIGPSSETEAAAFTLPADPGSDVIDECRACAEEHCSDQLRVCEENPRCRAMLSCSSDCSDPACLADCKDTLPPSPAYDALFNCVYLPVGLEIDADASACTYECKVSQHWGCSNIYSWPTQRGALTARLHLMDGFGRPKTPLSTFSEVLVSACNSLATGDPGGEAGCAASTAMTDDYGNVSVPYPQGSDAFIITGGLDEQQRLYTRRITGAGVVERFLLDRPTLLLYLESILKIPVDHGKGIINVGIDDCLGTDARAVYEISSPGAPAPYYFDRNGVPSQSNPPVGGALFLNIDLPADRTVSVVARDPDSGAMLAQRRVIVDARWTTDVRFPAPSAP